MILRPLSKSTRWLLCVILPQAFLAGAALAATSVSQFGITWTFDKNYPTGQFANGDYWVVGPVKIVSISPRSSTSGGVTMNGSMINPAVNGSQGYDSRIKNNTYSASLNVGASLPLTLNPGTSLLSSASYPSWASGDNPQLRTIAILTVLTQPAPTGSFRPPYIGADKTLRWNKSQLQYNKLRSLAPVAYTPALATVEQRFERPWIEQKTNWSGRYMHPGENQPTYGRELAHALTDGLLSLQLNYTAAQKEKLLVRLVQYGIDIYGAARNGARWGNDGGHNQGRKMPLLLAGTVLGDSSILAYGDAKKNFIFQEDQQTWYVTSADVGRTLYTADGRPRERYISSDVGTAEWGEKHTGDPSRDGRNWNAYYRNVTGGVTTGHLLVARLMGLESKWNWPAAFDYYDRYWAIEGKNSSTGANSIQPFVASMWKAYRNSKGADFTENNVATEIWENTSIAAQTGAFTVSFDVMPSGSKIDGVTGLSNGAADDDNDLVASVRFAPTGCIEVLNGGGYQAAAKVTYTGGVRYRVVMSVDLPKHRYSVTVTPAGGSAVRIADNWAFASGKTSVSTLNNVGFCAVSGAHAVLDLGVQSATPPPPAPTTSDTANESDKSTAVTATLTNGSFESGTTGWSASGNLVVVASGGSYKATSGSKLLVFNGGQAAPNGSVTQKIATVPGTKYTVSLDMGVLAFNTKEQRLAVTVQGSKPLVSSTTTLQGKKGGSTVWKKLSYTFTADSSSTTLTLKDVSTTSDSLDLLVDNVVFGKN